MNTNIHTTRPSLCRRRHAGAHRNKSVCARGFTLMELLIVLTVIVTIASMAVPQLMSMMRESAVFEAADRVREAIGETRRFAIDSGIDYEFRYEVNGSSVVVLPSEQELNVDESQSTSNTTEKYMRLLVELPKDIQISAASGTEAAAETLDATRFGDLSGSMLTQKTWSAPVMFRFDGTAEDFAIHVSDADRRTSKVTIRGLTGSTRISQVFQEEI